MNSSSVSLPPQTHAHKMNSKDTREESQTLSFYSSSKAEIRKLFVIPVTQLFSILVLPALRNLFIA